MALSYQKNLKINGPLILLSGFLMILSSVSIFLLVVKYIYGNFTVAEILPTTENLTLYSSKIYPNTAVLNSEYTENLLPKESTWLKDNIDVWETYLNNANVRYDLIEDRDIELGKLNEYEILILPGSKALSDLELSEIKTFLLNGGKVFSTGGLATYSTEGKWQGWEFFNEVFGLSFTKEITNKEYYQKHTLRAGLPLTTGIDAGFGLKIATWDRPINAEILEPRVDKISFWFDYKEQSGLVIEEINKSVGAAYGTYGDGKFIWFGFELNSILGEKNDYVTFEKFFNNCINWLSGAPNAEMKRWPDKYDAAAIVTANVDGKFRNTNKLKSLLERENKRIEWLSDSHSKLGDKLIYKSLLKYGDVIPKMNLDVPVNYSNENKKNFNFRLINSVNSELNGMGNFLGHKTNGAYLHEEKFNEIDLFNLFSKNCDYIVTKNDLNYSVPKYLSDKENSLLMIPLTGRSDKKIINEYGLTNIDFQLYTYEEDVKRVLIENGLYTFEISSSLQMDSNYFNVIPKTINILKENNFWITDASQLFNWYDKKSSVQIKTNLRSERRIAIEISNTSEKLLNDITVNVFVNRNIFNVELSSDMMNTDIPVYEYDVDKQLIKLDLKELDADETKSFFIDFTNTKV